MDNKICNTCKFSKPLNEFGKDNRIKCGYGSICKKCINEKRNNHEQKQKQKLQSKKYRTLNKEKKQIFDKKYRDLNKEKIKEYQKRYGELNKEDLKEYKKEWDRNNSDYQKKYNNEYYSINKEHIKEQAKKYRDENREKINKYVKNRKKNDPLFKLRHSIGNSILKAIKKNGFSKKSKTQQILGCTYENFKSFLESKFEPWMNWNNHGLYNGEYSFGWDVDHIIPISSIDTENELLKLNFYTNLQPLCSKVNRDIKRDKI